MNIRDPHPFDRGELMAKRQELQLKNRAAAEAVAEQRKNREKDDCIHARDAIQPRSRTPGFLPTIRFSGTTVGAMVIVNTVVYVRDHLGGTASDTALVLAAAGAGSHHRL